eukprot:Sdes_comp20409_c0_seq1m14436
MRGESFLMKSHIKNTSENATLCGNPLQCPNSASESISMNTLDDVSTQLAPKNPLVLSYRTAEGYSMLSDSPEADSHPHTSQHHLLPLYSTTSGSELNVCKQNEAPKSSYWRSGQFCRALLVAIFLGVLGGLFLGVVLSGQIPVILRWIGQTGVFGNLFMMFLFTVLAFPFAFGYTPLALAAGFLWGVFWGTVTISVGSFLGCSLVYFLCQTTWRGWVEKNIIQDKLVFKLFLKSVQQNAFKIIFLGRLTPIPFGIQNVVYSISPISYAVYILSSILGLIPEQILLTYFGHKMENISEIINGTRKLSTLEKMMPLVELLLIILLICFVTALGKRALKQAMSEMEDSEAVFDRESEISCDSSLGTSPFIQTTHPISNPPSTLFTPTLPHSSSSASASAS